MRLRCRDCGVMFTPRHDDLGSNTFHQIVDSPKHGGVYRYPVCPTCEGLEERGETVI